jgi:hypothetical protein
MLVNTPPIVEFAPVQFTVDIFNTGEVDISNQFFVSLYFDPAPEPVINTTTHISSTYRVNLSAVSNLAGNGGRTITMSVPAGFSGAFTHTVYAVVDSDPAPGGLINEVETNNIASLEVPVDMSLTTPTPSPTPPTNAPGTVSGKTRVILGNDVLEQFNVEVNAYYNNGLGDVTWIRRTFSNADGIYLFSPPLPSTSGGATYTLTGCITINEVEYFGTFSGVTVPPNGTAIVHLYLQANPCS